METGWASVDDLVATLGLDADPADPVDVKRALLGRLKTLQESHPGNSHPMAAVFVGALSYIDPDGSQIEIPGPASVAERPAQVPRLPLTEVAKVAASSREAVAGSIEPARRTLRNQTIGLSVVAVVLGALWAMPDQVATHPFVPDVMRREDGELRGWVGVVWFCLLLSTGLAWLFLWRREQRFEAFVRRLNDTELQLDAVRFAVQDGKTTQWLELEEYDVALLALAQRSAPQDAPYDPERSEKENNQAWLEWHQERWQRLEDLPDDWRRAVTEARDEALNRFTAVGWLELERDYAFSRSYKIVGVYEH